MVRRCAAGPAEPQVHVGRRQIPLSCRAHALFLLPMQVDAGLDVRTCVRHTTQMRRTATDLRAHLYKVLDHVAKTGEPVYVTRGGVELCIVRQAAAPQKRKKPRVIPRLIVGDPDALVHVEWPWSEGRDL